MNSPQGSPKPKPNKFFDFGPQPEHLVEKARAQIKAGRRQYLESVMKIPLEQLVLPEPDDDGCPYESLRHYEVRKILAARAAYLALIEKEEATPRESL